MRVAEKLAHLLDHRERFHLKQSPQDTTQSPSSARPRVAGRPARRLEVRPKALSGELCATVKTEKTGHENDNVVSCEQSYGNALSFCFHARSKRKTLSTFAGLALCGKIPAFPASCRYRVFARYLGMMAALIIFLALPSQASAKMCSVTVGNTWLGTLTSSASIVGACDKGTVKLVVYNKNKEVVWHADYALNDLFGFDDTNNNSTITAALNDWLGDYVDITSTSQLPEWRLGADTPMAGEFPFYPDKGISRFDYEDLRTANYPMICYIQGQESTLCLYQGSKNGPLIRIGVQSFPG